MVGIEVKTALVCLPEKADEDPLRDSGRDVLSASHRADDSVGVVTHVLRKDDRGLCVLSSD
jgi:hypothetical protein